MPHVPPGTILLWSGPIGAIPAGFILCDGAGGSPDLRNRFIIGAGDTYNPDDSGGNVSHNHTFTGDGHSHSIGGGTELQAGASFDDDTATDPATGTTDNGSSLPPYYSLAYIIKT